MIVTTVDRWSYRSSSTSSRSRRSLSFRGAMSSSPGGGGRASQERQAAPASAEVSLASTPPRQALVGGDATSLPEVNAEGAEERPLAREAYAAAYAVGREPRILCEWGMAELAVSAHDDAATYLDRCLKDPRAGTIEQRRRYLSGLEQARREAAGSGGRRSGWRTCSERRRSWRA
ncbi:hypothetical protein BE17_20240 [Sorangium cellulosum]|uniref:Uncharacterized protein n=1 Tax=Sorangium cellulosum TaxID=56 RepID=A0A150RLX8_SORCE|nr:hypothetical protein BE17_20240 [Sorangium cellulosum]